MNKKLKAFISLALACVLLVFPTFNVAAVQQKSGIKNNITSNGNLSKSYITDFLKNNDYIEQNGNFIFSSTRKLGNRTGEKDYLILISTDQKEAEEIRKDLKILKNQASQITPFSSGGSNYKYKWDDSGQMYGYLTANYEISTLGGDEYIKITSVTGGFSSNSGSGNYVGSGVYVTEQFIDVGQVGKVYNGGYKSQRKMNVSFSPSKRTWSYNPPSSWLPVNIENTSTMVGANYYITLKRGSSTWDVEIQNTLVDSGVPEFDNR